MSLDKYKIDFNTLDQFSWTHAFEDRFDRIGLPDNALFIENGIVEACNLEHSLKWRAEDELHGEGVWIRDVNRDRYYKMRALIDKWNKEKPDPNIIFVPGQDHDISNVQISSYYTPTFRLKGYFTNEETLEACMKMMWDHVESEDFYVYVIKDKTPVTERVIRVQNLRHSWSENDRELAKKYYGVPFEQRPSCLQIGPFAIIERPFKFPFKEIKTEKDFGIRMWTTLLNHLPEAGKENDYNALKEELYKQRSMEVVLYQAFKHVERYIKSHPTLDPLGKWRNKLDEQLTAGTAINGDLMGIFNYYAKHKDKTLSDEANWDKAIECYLEEKKEIADKTIKNTKDEYDDFE